MARARVVADRNDRRGRGYLRRWDGGWQLLMLMWMDEAVRRPFRCGRAGRDRSVKVDMNRSAERWSGDSVVWPCAGTPCYVGKYKSERATCSAELLIPL